ncbi:hypothetical protein OQJ02_09185 [Legionella sp. PATHC032]|uniref:hypothetical protein n=1 Tax=Legionella sp. PATHC032 TaxID=2992039 RepID=UPI001B236DD4|nr:hypothetical protein [Legionella sp. PATHC032]MCW8421804.1 hypothetical protein [Legionella sp. PATHC032]HAZ7574283.1 hypothetical protein [Legionella pneumophila]HBA1636441.1 hypothetical protein [Legionella pneumophila]
MPIDIKQCANLMTKMPFTSKSGKELALAFKTDTTKNGGSFFTARIIKISSLKLKK